MRRAIGVALACVVVGVLVACAQTGEQDASEAERTSEAETPAGPSAREVSVDGNELVMPDGSRIVLDLVLPNERACTGGIGECLSDPIPSELLGPRPLKQLGARCDRIEVWVDELELNRERPDAILSLVSVDYACEGEPVDLSK
jgi:hypothetical protein